MLPRPKPKETEEDLLKFQEEFLHDKSIKTNVAATVRNDKRKADGDVQESADDPNGKHNRNTVDPAEQPSSNDQSHKKVKWKINDQSGHCQKVHVDEELPDQQENSGILLAIVERDTSTVKVEPPKKQKGQPFPMVHRRDTKLINANGQQANVSIFAQQIRKTREQLITNTSKQENSSGPAECSSIVESSSVIQSNVNFDETSMVVDGTGLVNDEGKSSIAKEIHQENLTKIAQMSQADILNEQQQLLGALNPDIIRFLKSKRQKEQSTKARVEEIDSHKHIQDANVNVKLSESPEVEQKNAEDIATEVLEELPISASEAKRWLHMDKVEVEKLGWMTNLPKPKPVDQKSGYPARFDFDGILVARDNDIPTHRGLHHHGEDPEVPGYTLEELFIYGRSAIMQQRVLAISVLAKILTKSQDGQYDEFLSEPMLPQLLNAGLALLLRWALDDNTEGSVAAAVAAIHALIVSIPDEVCLNRTLWWNRGIEVPFLQPEEGDTSDDPTAKKEGEEELIDAELVKLDVIKGLLRMDILPRLRYILKACHPSATVVVQIVEILCRIASHSLESAYAITRSHGLLEILCADFLPKSWPTAEERTNVHGQMADVTGVPLPQVVKLIRTLASSERHIAADLVDRYDIIDSLLCYASIDPNEGHIPTKEAMQLCLMSYSAWQVFLNYGLATWTYSAFYPFIMRQMQFYQTLCLNVDVVRQAYNFDQATAVLRLLTTVLDLTLEKCEPEGTKTTLIEWQQVDGLMDVVEIYVKKWLWELENTDEEVTHSALRLVGAALGWIATFYNNLSKQTFYNPPKVLDKIENVYTSAIIPFMKSKVFETLLSNICPYSSLLCPIPNGRKRDSTNLPSLGAILWGGHINPILEEKSPFSFLTQFGYLLHVFNHLHSSLNTEIRALFLDHPAIISYLRQIVSSSTNSDTKHWFSRFETHFLFNLLELGASKKCTYTRVYHEAALQLLPKLLRGDETLAHQLMATVIFNGNFLSEFSDLAEAIDNLKLKEPQTLATPTLEKVEASQLKLLQNTRISIPNICTTYQNFLEKHLLMHKFSRVETRNSLGIQHYLGQPVPSDYVFLPISILYNSSLALPASTTPMTDISKAEDKQVTVLHCLQWCFLMECWRKDALCCLSPDTRFCHLATVFLISTDLFLHATVRSYLEGCFRKEAERQHLAQLTLGKNPLPGIASFYDLYMQLLDQFEGASYGDHLFGMVILVPMQQRHSIQFRKAIWTEHISVGRLLGVEIRELLVPLENYLFPLEDNSDLLVAYFRALINGFIRQTWCPVLFVIAVHHLHHFLYDSTVKDIHRKLRSEILSKLNEPKNKALSNILQCYKKPDANSVTGYLSDENPSEEVRKVGEELKKGC